MKAHISGFPELLPEEKIAQDKMLDTIKSVYESYGYAPIETPAVERLDTLLAKGADDKEIYAVVRHDEAASPGPAEMGLHFDLTVPFARYVAGFRNELSFPFKRYQIQKCWRGERPQEGRFREFCQADVDVIGIEKLPVHFDAETLEIGTRALHAITPDNFTMSINNRRIIDGMAKSFGLSESTQQHLTATVDKIGKIGIDKCRALLEESDVPNECTEFVLGRHGKPCAPSEVRELFDPLDGNESLQQGIDEMESVGEFVDAELSKYLQYDLCTVRGLDYYTGTIFEGRLEAYPNLSVCAGGRYDNLSSLFGNQKLPGVGISIGVSRLFYLLQQQGQVDTAAASLSRLLIAAFSEEQRLACHQLALQLRARGLTCEEYHDFTHPPGKQIQYANKKGIGHVLFVEKSGELSIKNLETREQNETTMDDVIELLKRP